MLTDSVRAIQQRSASTAWVKPVSGGVAAFSTGGSPLNKVAGLGFAGPLDADEFAHVEQSYLKVGAPIQVELATLGDPSIATFLTRRGYHLVGFENVLGMRLEAPRVTTQTATGQAAVRHAAPAGCSISECQPADFESWLNVMIDGFLSPDIQGIASHESFSREVMDAILRDTSTVPAFHRYLVLRDGLPAAGAGMRASDGMAMMCGATTLPAHRRHGIQSALLTARLRDAADWDCQLALMTALPGSKSHENAQRRGFELLYARAILVRDTAYNTQSPCAE